MQDELVTDNGRNSAEFAVFARQKGITHMTSSPHYAQSNGKSENAVNMLKLLCAKAKQSGEPECMAILGLRNMPSECMSTSPAQRLMGRRCKTYLPTVGTLLKPQYSPLLIHIYLAIFTRREAGSAVVSPSACHAGGGSSLLGPGTLLGVKHGSLHWRLCIYVSFGHVAIGTPQNEAIFSVDDSVMHCRM